MLKICQEKNLSSGDRPDIKNLTPEELSAWLKDNGVDAYRTRQIFKWIYIRNADRFEDMTDLGKDLRARLAATFSIPRLAVQKVETAGDGTSKFLFRLSDGAHIESVLIPERDHDTLCISSQVGCAMGCAFCRTARGGFIRNLTAGEILSQVRDISRLAPDRRLTNVVFMGMGEPLANYENVVNALKMMTENDCGMKFSSRKVTVSTAGWVPKMMDLGKDTRVSLAVSLNATQNETRDLLMPVNHRYPLETLLEACLQYPLPPTRRITFEYVLLAGINDTPEDARRLSKLLAPLRAKVNLIPFNAFEGAAFHRPEEARILNFQNILMKKNLTAIIRSGKGRDISAACGQLAANAMMRRAECRSKCHPSP
ncbi:MAG: 23S rRNA (adenine(2503)-C(2))-methyltransferase RlmN [Deltaproteobacteria bacterium]|nr:23S rRNA (adenine(2503)-C(2))-methyltransferase RlmN [Deltaproteobacteria bacterium]MBW2040498.1 23S rRNA (adenine(2503)-C(2))-methyltransferase RlmN [Deltaproteobacteria bacterium]MBW2131366.1 23S rRNA (adenine(2503)-C(2))-methyltransferase RlmN [Deltaproteobacteria bacterium]